MGNRAFVLFRDKQGRCSPATYLHSYGSPEHVHAFVKAAHTLGMMQDVLYVGARFIQMCANYLDQRHPTHRFLGIGVESSPESVEDLDADALDKLSYLITVDSGLYIFGLDGQIQARLRRYGTDIHYVSEEDLFQEQKVAKSSREYSIVLNAILDDGPDPGSNSKSIH